MGIAGRVVTPLMVVASILGPWPTLALAGSGGIPIPTPHSVGSLAYTARVSVTNQGGQMRMGGSFASMSDNGRMVAFTATVQGHYQIFVRDRWRGTTRLVSVRNTGQRFPSAWYSQISGNGRFVAFNVVTRTGGDAGVYVRDLRARRTIPVSVDLHGQIVGTTAAPSISDDGRYVAFESWADTLVRGDTNRKGDIFVRDLWAHKTVRVSTSTAGRQANQYSWNPTPVVANGRLIYFETLATNLTPNRRPGWVGHNLVTGRSWWLKPAMFLPRSLFEDYDNFEPLGLSTDGRYVAFNKRFPCGATTCIGVYVRDRRTGVVQLASMRNDGQPFPKVIHPALSPSGRFLVFNTTMSSTTQVWLRDLKRQHTRLISIGFDARPANGKCHSDSVSTDGRTVAFDSNANNLVRGDTNGNWDVFVRRRP